MTLRAKTALITGGANGIGKCTALFLLRAGMNVVIADLDQEAGLETVQDYREIGPIHFVPTDVSQEPPVQHCVQKTVELFGTIHALVNNAGVGFETKIEQLSLEQWHRVIDTNLTSCFLTAKHALPHLKQNPGAAIVNISSIKGLQAIISEADSEAYVAGKGAVIAFTHALAISQGPHVRVNCISPGWIITDQWRPKRLAQLRQLSPQDQNQHPVGRIGWPEDIAAMVQYLISDAAGFITGQNFVIDGGMSKAMIYPSCPKQ